MSKRTVVLRLLVFIAVMVIGVLMGGGPGRRHALWNKITEGGRVKFGLSWESLYDTPEVKQLRDVGVPLATINAYVGGSGYEGTEELYPVTDKSYLVVWIGSQNSLECVHKDAKFGISCQAPKISTI